MIPVLGIRTRRPMPHAEQLPLQPEQFVPLRPERTIHARSHGDVLARDFELAQRIGHAVGNPCVAGHDGHPYQLDAGGLRQRQHGDPVIEAFHHVAV